MSTPALKSDQPALRIGLDQAAASAYHTMVERLKTDNPHVKITPSRFVTFIVKHYFEDYFEKDRKLLARQFFDSKEYLSAELKKAKSPEEVRTALEKVMQEISSSVPDTKRPKRTKKEMSESNANEV